MNRKDAKKLLPIIQAYCAGKEIEIIIDNNWVVIDNPEFNTSWDLYRIKQEPEYVPFTFEDINLFGDKWFKNKVIINGSSSGNLFKPIHSNINGLSFFINEYKFYSYVDILSTFVFLDGSPCGKLKQ